MLDYYNTCLFINENDQPLDDFSRRFEEGSRYLLVKYHDTIKNMNILELGARYGTVSVCLDYIVKDGKNKLVCVDPDPNIRNALFYSRDKNNCSFNIFNGAISKNSLYVCHNGNGWETKTYIDPPKNLPHQKIETKTLDEIQSLYNIKFDCLLADCEGFLLQFIEENESFFDNLQCVIYEEDCNKNHPINGSYIDYDLIESFLKNKGFKLIESYIDFIGLYNKIWMKNYDITMDNFHIFIASCFEGLDTQIPRLIKNIIDVNIPLDYVHFIVGGCPENKIYYSNGIEIVNVTYRCFEFTPHLYIINNENKYDFNFAFFTHDTVKFGNSFYNVIMSDIKYLKNTNYDCMKIENMLPSMNIGIYSKNIILKNKETLLKLSVNTNEYNILMSLKHDLVSYEDFILNQNNYNNGDFSENHSTVFEGINKTISHGLVRFFKRIDFIKYQMNANNIQSIDICKIDNNLELNFELIDLIDNTKTDKNTLHSYIPIYQDLLHNKKESAKNVLEIGIFHGGSIKLWHDYFINANIYGLDIMHIDQVWHEIRDTDRIILHTSTNAYDENFFKTSFLDKNIKFDILIDDGPHTLESMIIFINLYTQVMSDDGILIIEDVEKWGWIDILKNITPEHLKQYIKVYDLRSNKNRFDDILFVIDKTS